MAFILSHPRRFLIMRRIAERHGGDTDTSRDHEYTDWDDLARPGISVITPNPKTSGGARWNYLAAWAYALRKPGGDEAKARDFVTRLFKNVPVLDTGARGSTITFAQRNQGDVLIAWENEAYLLEKEFGNKVDVVYPSISVLAEPPVTVVDKNVDKKGTRAVAEEYLKFLYTEEGQDIAGKNFYRPTDPKAAEKLAELQKELQTLLSSDPRAVKDMPLDEGIKQVLPRF